MPAKLNLKGHVRSASGKTLTPVRPLASPSGDASISQLDTIPSLASGDLFVVVDISDSTDGVTGTTKKVTYANLLAATAPGSGTPALSDTLVDSTSGGTSQTVALNRLLALIGVPTGFVPSLTSGASNTAGPSYTGSTLYAVPFVNNQWRLYDGTSWKTYASGQLSLALSGLTNTAIYDAFVYDAGTPTSPSVRGSASSNGTPITLPTNSANDLMLLFVWNVGTGTPPGLTNWVLKDSVSMDPSSGPYSVALYTRTSAGGETSVTPPGGRGTVVVMNGGAYDVSATASTGSGQTNSVVAPTVTPSTTAEILLNFYLAETGTLTIPGAQTKIANSSFPNSMIVGWEAVSGVVATGTRTATNTATTFNAAISVLVKTASASGPTLELGPAWTSTSLRSAALAQFDGVWCKATDQKRLYFCTIHATGATTTVDSAATQIHRMYWRRPQQIDSPENSILLDPWSFSAGGELAGTFPNPTLAISGLPVGTLAMADKLALYSSSTFVNGGALLSSVLALTMGCPGGRLGTAAGDPYNLGLSGTSVLYYTAVNGNNIIVLYNGTRWQAVIFTEVTLTLSTLANVMYDVFAVYASSTSFTLEVNAWKNATVTITNASPGVVTYTSHGMAVGDQVSFTTTGALPTGLSAGTIYFVVSVPTGNTFQVSATPNGTAINTSSAGSGTHTCYQANHRGTDVTIQDGRYCKSGDKQRLYLGTLMCTAANTLTNTVNANYLWNTYNQIEIALTKTEATANWSYTGVGAFRAANGSASNRLIIVRGLDYECVKARAMTTSFAFTAGAAYNSCLGIGINSVTTNSATHGGGFSSNAAEPPTDVCYHGRPGLGLVNLQWLEYADSRTSTQYIGSNGDSNQWKFGIAGEYKA